MDIPSNPNPHQAASKILKPSDAVCKLPIERTREAPDADLPAIKKASERSNASPKPRQTRVGVDGTSVGRKN